MTSLIQVRTETKKWLLLFMLHHSDLELDQLIVEIIADMEAELARRDRKRVTLRLVQNTAPH